MVTAQVKALFPCDVQKVWDIITSLENYSWRGDLSKIETLAEGQQFIEYTKEGYVTRFTITAYILYERYEFDLENENMKGHFCGVFSFGDGKTSIDFTECVMPKKWWLIKPLVKIYLKKRQAAYIADLRKASLCL